MKTEVSFKNKQWQVTGQGLEAVDRDYVIDSSRLLETHRHPWESKGTVYAWPTHMAKKGWVDYEAFLEAWWIALLRHGKTKINSVKLGESLFQAAGMQQDLKNLLKKLPDPRRADNLKLFYDKDEKGRGIAFGFQFDEEEDDYSFTPEEYPQAFGLESELGPEGLAAMEVIKARSEVKAG